MLQYIRPYKTPLRDSQGEIITYLIWGDPVLIKDSNPPDAEVVEVIARNYDGGFLSRSDLTDESLLEIYVIDVGQGDGVLMRTPDDKWHLIDAGVTNERQMTKKGAANFVRWKFLEELRRDKIELENLILSHPDFDHFGGMINLLSGRLRGHEDFEVEVNHFYHNGLGRFKNSPKLGQTTSGQIDAFPQGYHGIRRKGTFITELLDDKASFTSPTRPFSDSFSELAEALSTDKVKNISRLSKADGFLPGYDESNTDITIKILGPILEEYEKDKTGLRRLSGGDSITTNGQSIVLRLEFGKASILLNGDLNSKSMKLLLSYLPEEAFSVDVAKGCHHGSEDVHMDFLKAMQPKATVISSGDNESHSHPRPLIIGASAYHGSEFKGEDGKMYPPLVYSTELARSTKLSEAVFVKTRDDWDDKDYDRHFAHNTLIKAKGDNRYRRLKFVPINTDLIYGLVNIRTDGKKIMLATKEEVGGDFDFKVIDLE